MLITKASLRSVERRHEVHRPKSERRGLVDVVSGGVALSSSRRHAGRGRARQSAPHHEGNAARVAFEKFITEGNEKPMSLQEGSDPGRRRYGAGVISFQQEREDGYAALQHAASFHCVVEAWKDCEELRPKPTEKWVFVNRECCAAANKYRCMRCGISSKHMKIKEHVRDESGGEKTPHIS